jgi:hypothetical protein
MRPIIHAKLDALMDNEGLLTHYVAYGRIAFTLTLKLHLDNMMQRESEIEGSSAAPAVNDPDAPPLEAPPLADPSPDAIIVGTELTYVIDSPNAERLRHGLPVPIMVKQPDGTTTQESVTYPKDDTIGDGDETITDVTPKTRAAWKK